VPEKRLCPICGFNGIADWEVCCGCCWKYIGELDKMFGTDYQKRLTEGKSVVIWERLVVKQTGCYFPLSKGDRIERAQRISKSICNKCNKEVEDGCENCVWHSLMQSIIGEEIW